MVESRISGLWASMSRLRVMHLVVAGDLGGAERLLTDLATRPQETAADHEIALITPNRDLLAFFRAAALTVHDRGPTRENPLSYLRQALGPADVTWLVSLLEARRIDIVHTHTFGSHVLGTRAALRARIPQVRTEHHVMHYFDPTCSLFTRWAAARTTHFIAISEYVRSVIAKTAPALGARTTVVRNGIDTDHWTARAEPGNDFTVGVVCRLTAWKRVHLAVQAAARANVALLIVGDGEERRALEASAIRHRASVTFAGHQKDPRPFIAGCHATLSAADKEPFGLSVLESLSMARPVIAFGGGGIPEIVQDGVTGFLVSDPSAGAFAAAIERARADLPRLRVMGASGRRFAQSHGTVEQMCAGYAAAYGAVAEAS